ncbi:MAG: hypothetical protein ACFFCD_10405 [Promethearchaeota archaeon]
MTCRYLKKENGTHCQLKNSQISEKYARRVCNQDTDAAICIKAVEALKEADRLSKENNISCMALYREASSYFAEVKDFLKAISSRLKLITFLKRHDYYDQAISEAKEVKELYNNALKSTPSLRSTEIGEKIASLEQSLQIAYNQSENAGLVRPSAVLQTISEIQIEEAVGRAKHYSIENDLEKEIENVIEKEVTDEHPSEPISELSKPIPEIEASDTATEVGGTTEEVATVEPITTETVETVEVGGTIESVETIEEADSSVGFLSHYAEKAEKYEELAESHISVGVIDEAAKYTALSTICFLLAGNPQEGLMVLNRLLKNSKATERQTIKKDHIFIIARSLILASFYKDMGKYYEAELLIRQLKGYSDEEMELISQGLKTVKELIE